MIADRAFVAAEILDDTFGAKDFHELLGEKIADAADVAFDRYDLYGYEEDEVKDFAILRMTTALKTWYDYENATVNVAENMARRIYEGWEHSGVL